MGYEYYDTPEGEDCFKKLWYTTKMATAFGLGVSSFDVLLYSHPQGYFQTIARYGHFTIPFIGIAAAYTTTACAAASLRKKDDYLNGTLGGAAAGGIAGVWRKSAFNGFRFGLVFCAISAVKKSYMDYGWEFFPQNPTTIEGSLRGVRHDYTITQERPRNWSRE